MEPMQWFPLSLFGVPGSNPGQAGQFSLLVLLLFILLILSI